MYVQSLRGKKGFTLIEIAVVIMIIGIIIGAVMKGKDIARTAQVKDFLQGFAGKWKAVAETYYDRVGQELSDGSKNGNTGSSDGYMDGISADSGNGSGSSSIIGVAKLNAGMNLCDIVKSNVIQGGACSNQKDIANFRVTGETAGIVTVTAILGNYKSTNTPTDQRNAVILQGVPGDVAEAIDKAYDGIPDGTIGVVLNCGCSSSNGNLGRSATGFINGSTVCGQNDYDTTTGNLCTVALTLDH